MVVMQTSWNRTRNSHKEELEEPWPYKTIGIFIGKTPGLELCEFRLYACTLGRNEGVSEAQKSLVAQGFFALSLMGIIFYVIRGCFWASFLGIVKDVF